MRSGFQNTALHLDTTKRLREYAAEHHLKLSQAVDKAIMDSRFFGELYDMEITPVLKDEK